MAYVLEISRRVISPYAESCQCPEDLRHECDDTCRWLDGDCREIQDLGTVQDVMDSYDAEEYGDPVTWAAFHMSKHYPEISTTSSGRSPETFSGQWNGSVSEREWLSGNSEDPYSDNITETTIYVKGDFTENQRSRVFALAGLSYQNMVSELRAKGNLDG